VPHQFPWLALLDGTYLSVPDGEVHCIPAAAPGNSRCHGSVGGGGWLFLQNFDFDSGVFSLSVTNRFSEDVLSCGCPTPTPSGATSPRTTTTPREVRCCTS
jgi:hypothetical protein